MVKRYRMLRELADLITDELVVFYRVGISCFEWEHLTGHRDGNIILGDMGCTTGVGIGLAMALPHRKVIVVDGDGSVLLEPGVLAVLANSSLPNLTVLIHDNEAYESIGWSKKGRYRTETFYKTDLEAMARGAGVERTRTVRELSDFRDAMQQALNANELTVVVAKTEDEAAQARPRHTSSKEEKYRFIRYLERAEGLQILRLSVEKERLVEPKAARRTTGR